MAQKTKFGMVAGLAGAALMISAAPTSAATVNLNDAGFITNGGFDTGALTPWVAGGADSAGVYAPGASQYTAGSDGLAAGVAPSPRYVAYIPATGGAGAGSVQQTLTTTFLAGNTYTLTFYVGMPNQVFGTFSNGPPYTFTGNCSATCANHNTAASAITASANIGYDNGGSLVGGAMFTYNETFSAVPLLSLGLGTWEKETISVSVANGSEAVGKKIDIAFSAALGSGSIDQPHQVDFDILGTGLPEGGGGAGTTPLPAALPLFAGGLGMIGLLARRRKQKNVAA